MTTTLTLTTLEDVAVLSVALLHCAEWVETHYHDGPQKCEWADTLEGLLDQVERLSAQYDEAEADEAAQLPLCPT